MRPSDIPAFAIMALGLLCIFLLFGLKLLNAVLYMAAGFVCLSIGLHQFVDGHLMPFCDGVEDGIIAHMDWVKNLIDCGVDFFTK